MLSREERARFLSCKEHHVHTFNVAGGGLRFLTLLAATTTILLPATISQADNANTPVAHLYSWDYSYPVSQKILPSDWDHSDYWQIPDSGQGFTSLSQPTEDYCNVDDSCAIFGQKVIGQELTDRNGNVWNLRALDESVAHDSIPYPIGFTPSTDNASIKGTNPAYTQLSNGFGLKSDGSVWELEYGGIGKTGPSKISGSITYTKIVSSAPTQTAQEPVYGLDTDGNIRIIATRFDEIKNTIIANGPFTDFDTINPTDPKNLVSMYTQPIKGLSKIPTFVAVKADGVYTWGSNQNALLGQGSNNETATPTTTPKRILAGDYRQVALAPMAGMALKTDGTVMTWGINGRGTLGDEKTNHGSTCLRGYYDCATTPVQANINATITRIHATREQTAAPVNQQTYKVQEAGATSLMAAVDNTGHVWYWGGDASNIVNHTNKKTPVTISPTRYESNIFALDVNPTSEMILGYDSTRTSAQTVVQMPTTGAPDGLSTIGLLATGISLAGVSMLLIRRRA